MHYDELYLHSPLTTTIFIGSVVFYASGILGKGMFESTVIQFGTDQMIEASVISPTQYYSCTGNIGVCMLVMFVLMLFQL